MSIRALRPRLSVAGDPSGPWDGGRPLKILVDLQADSRQIERLTGLDRLEVPVAEHMLWTLCQHERIELVWIAEEGEDGPGALHYQPPAGHRDKYLPYVVTTSTGHSMSAVWQHDHLRKHAVENPPTPLEAIVKASTPDSLRADLMVTDDPDVLTWDGPGSNRANVMRASDALALIGLLLRELDSVPVIGPKAFSIDTQDLAWTAVRAQLPAGWEWGNALVDHSIVSGDDYSILLFGSFFDRLVRVLRQRDGLHLARFRRASHRTGLVATEALDTLMFNVVGAFDAAAIAAHIGAGLPASERRYAGWQNKDWRRSLGVEPLNRMFHKRQPAEDLFAVLRTLRNTVHGAGLNSRVMRSAGSKEHLVQIPTSEAEDVRERLERIGSKDGWGIRSVHGETFVDPAQLVELLLPIVFETLNKILSLTPRTALERSGTTYLDDPPDEIPFDLGSRSRACLLYGLAVPSS